MRKIIVCATLLVAGTRVHAQPAAPATAPAPADASTEDDKRAQAKALYEKGLTHYNLGEFDEAISAFRAAYAISSAPGLLFNIAQSFRLKKDYENAAYFYTTYLRLKPDAPNRADVEARIKDVTDLLEKQKKQESAPPVGTVTPDGDQKSEPQASDATTKPAAVTVNLVDGRGRTDTAAPDNSKTLMTAGLATGGAGVALVVTGLVFGKMAKSAEEELNQLSPDMGTWSQAHQDTYDAGKRNNAIAVISFIAGGAAVATGGTLWVLGKLKERDGSVAVVPTAGGTSVAVGWSF